MGGMEARCEILCSDTGRELFAYGDAMLIASGALGDGPIQMTCPEHYAGVYSRVLSAFHSRYIAQNNRMLAAMGDFTMQTIIVAHR